MVHRGRVKQTFVLAIQPQKLIVGVIEFRKQLKQVSLAFLSVSDIIFSLQCLAAFSGAFDRTGNLGGPFGFKCGFAIQAFANAINLFFLWVLFVPLFSMFPQWDFDWPYSKPRPIVYVKISPVSLHTSSTVLPLTTVIFATCLSPLINKSQMAFFAFDTALRLDNPPVVEFEAWAYSFLKRQPFCRSIDSMSFSHVAHPPKCPSSGVRSLHLMPKP